MKKEKLGLSKIVVNKKNDRFEPQVSEKKAIEEMVNRQHNKLYALGADIIENGLNPTVMLYGIRHNGKVVLKDGNRRITTIKLIKEDKLRNLIKDDGLREKFKKLSNESKGKLPAEFEVGIFETEEEADKWIDRMHAGEKGGIGQTKWDAPSKGRYEERRGNNPGLGHQALSILGENFNKDGISITTFQRVLGDPKVRDLFSIEVKDKTVDRNSISGLKKLANKIRNVKVVEVYNKKAIQNFFAITGESNEAVEESSSSQSRSKKAFDLVNLNNITPTTSKETDLLKEATLLKYRKQRMTSLFTFRSLFEITLYNRYSKLPSTRKSVKINEKNNDVGLIFLSKLAHKDTELTRNSKALLKQKTFERDFLSIVNKSLHNSILIPTVDQVETLIKTYFPILKEIWDEENR